MEPTAASGLSESKFLRRTHPSGGASRRHLPCSASRPAGAPHGAARRSPARMQEDRHAPGQHSEASSTCGTGGHTGVPQTWSSRCAPRKSARGRRCGCKATATWPGAPGRGEPNPGCRNPRALWDQEMVERVAPGRALAGGTPAAGWPTPSPGPGLWDSTRPRGGGGVPAPWLPRAGESAASLGFGMFTVTCSWHTCRHTKRYPLKVKTGPRPRWAWALPSTGPQVAPPGLLSVRVRLWSGGNSIPMARP